MIIAGPDQTVLMPECWFPAAVLNFWLPCEDVTGISGIFCCIPNRLFGIAMVDYDSDVEADNDEPDSDDDGE